MVSIQSQIISCLTFLNKATKAFPPTLTRALEQDFGRDPFLLLISCLLSLRARDTVTYPISKELFQRARTPEELLRIPQKDLEKLLYSLGFYKTKARRIKEVAQELISRFGGKVPRTQEELLSIKGVGRKTANLVLAAAFDIPAICVDTHVHRLANRWGWVKTKNTEQTEQELMKLVPKKYWNELNTSLVLWGQNACKPRSKSPCCTLCTVK